MPAIVIVLVAAVVAGGVAAVVLITRHQITPDSAASARAAGPTTTTTAATTTTSPTATTNPEGAAQAQQVNGLLSQSAADRTSLQSAVQELTSCQQIGSADTAVSQVQQSRQSLLDQLGTLDLSALPNGTQLATDLQRAWQDSLTADNDYVDWANGLLYGCDPATATDDSSYQQATQADPSSESAKAAFVSLWNQVAEQYGLATQTDNSF